MNILDDSASVAATPAPLFASNLMALYLVIRDGLNSSERQQPAVDDDTGDEEQPPA